VNLKTIKGEWTTDYRDHVIARHQATRDEHFEETCERLATGGVRVSYETYYGDGEWWD
jgi:hypothetical protein